jgi:hypothetical protein
MSPRPVRPQVSIYSYPAGSPREQTAFETSQHHRGEFFSFSRPPTKEPLQSVTSVVKGGLGDLQRIGLDSTGSYGAGLLRFMPQAGIPMLEVTTLDRQDRRRRGKNDDLDAQNATHAAFAVSGPAHLGAATARSNRWLAEGRPWASDASLCR